MEDEEVGNDETSGKHSQSHSKRRKALNEEEIYLADTLGSDLPGLDHLPPVNSQTHFLSSSPESEESTKTQNVDKSKFL